MKENENNELSSMAGAAREGGNTSEGIIGSAVSTAVGEAVATDDDQWIFDLAAEHEARGNGLYGPVTFDATGLVNFAQAVAARLAAPTQAKPVDLSGLTRYEVDMEGYVSEWPSGGYVRFADVERLFATPTQVSAPQASAAQEVRAVPGRALDNLGGAIKMAVNMLSRDGTPVRIEAAGALLAAFGEVAEHAVASTSTAPAAMDEVRDKVLEEAAQACQAWGSAKVAKWADVPDMLEDAKARAWDGLQCAAAIRAIKTSQASLDEVTGAGKGEGDA